MPAYGRGGAGNIEANAQAQSRAATDVEAQLKPGATANQSIESTDTSDRVQPQYAHSGRGGAGNFYSPKELQESGTFAGASSSHILGDGTPDPSKTSSSSSKAALPTSIKVGRGGAGNYGFGSSESQEHAVQRRLEEQRKAEELSAQVAKGVEEQLATPEKAKLSSANER